MSFRFLIAVVAAWTLVTTQAPAPAGGVAPLFDLRSPETSPFPSDHFSVADAAQLTGRRVNLPMPGDCAANASDCEDRALLNQLDGFNMQPRVSIAFSGDIDPASARENVFLVRLQDRRPIHLNYIVWDPATHELSGRPDELLDPGARYAIVVSTGVRDANGASIRVADGYRRSRADLVRDADRLYERALRDAEGVAGSTVGGVARIAALSVFTTQSYAHIIDRLHAAIERAEAPVLDFRVGPDGKRAVFDASKIQAVTHQVQTRVGGPLTAVPQNLRPMRVVPGAVGRLAFGVFRTLDFTSKPHGQIAPIPTRTGTVHATGTLDVAFNVWLPAGARPSTGWPVAIYGHGSFGTKNTAFSHAAVLNAHGIAVLSINGIGRGGGPNTTETVTLDDGTTVTCAAPGLGWDADGDGAIGDWEPRRAGRPFALLNTSGSIAQGVAQHFALIRALGRGVDVDGDGTTDLDASRLYYLGQSMGAMWGVLMFPHEPAIRAAVFNVAPGNLPYNTLLSSLDRAVFGKEALASRVPSLINAADGLSAIDGVAIDDPHFNENLPLRDRPPVVNTVAGAVAIQKFIDAMVWATQFSSTVTAAPRLGGGRPFIFQWARGDQGVPNPIASDLIRAGHFADRTFLYRHDRNVGSAGIPANPHAFLSTFGPAPEMMPVALGAQHQAAAFFERDGRTIPAPEPSELWEAPIRLPLPEDLHYRSPTRPER